MDIIANEAFLASSPQGFGSVCSDDVVSVVQVRSPLERVLSHREQRGLGDGLYLAVGNTTGPRMPFTDLSLADQLHHRPEVMSNYMTRYLLGRDAFWSSRGPSRRPASRVQEQQHSVPGMAPPIDLIDGVQAAQILARVDVILVLERQGINKALLTGMLNWTATIELGRRGQRRTGRQRGIEALMSDERAMLLRANAQDAVVFETAVLLNFLDVLVFGNASSGFVDPGGPIEWL